MIWIVVMVVVLIVVEVVVVETNRNILHYQPFNNLKDPVKIIKQQQQQQLPHQHHLFASLQFTPRPTVCFEFMYLSLLSSSKITTI